MQIVRLLIALTAHWSALMLVICWTFLEWFREEEIIELREEWIINEES